MNFKHLQKTKASIIIFGLLGLSLLSVVPAKATPVSMESASLSLQQAQTETPPMSITFTGWPLHIFLGGTAGLVTLSAMLLVDRVKRDKADKLPQQLAPSNKHYIKAIEAGDNFDNWLKLGTTLASQDQHEEAIECFDHAIKHEPFAALAWKGFGDSLFALRRFEEALDAYNAQIQAIGYRSNHQVEPVVEMSTK